MNAHVKMSRCGYLLAAGLFLIFIPAQAEEQAPVEKPSSASYSGSLRGTYDYRRLGSYDDHDAYGYWYLRGRNLADKRVDIYTSGRLHSDLDGTGKSYAADPFIGLDDTSRNDGLRLLQLYVDIHDRKNKMLLRAGRQYVDVADYIQMDGLQGMLFEKQRLGGRAFIGQPVSFYSSISGDVFGGASLVGKPWKGNQSRATYARYFDDSVGDSDEHYFFDVRQQVAETIRARTYLSVMNEDIRMGGGDLYYMSQTEKVFDAVIGARRWGEYDASTRAYSAMYQVLGDLEPYTTAYGRFTSQLLDWLYVSPGAYWRYPDHTDPTNHGYERYDLSFIYEPFESFNASIALEYWDVEENESFLGLSGDIRYRHRRLWEVSAGAAYVDYTYFQFSDFSVIAEGVTVDLDGTRVERSPYAFTYFLRGKWNISKHMALRLSGELEDNSENNDLGYRVRTSFEVRL